MQDTGSTTPLVHSTALRKEKITTTPHAAHPALAAFAQPAPAKQGWVKRALHFIGRLLGRGNSESALRTAAQRAAAARAAHMPESVAFKGATASTLVTPMGAYAGKPVEHAMRKRAEQQFKTMDISQTTMN
jgi:hypothetical protein